MMMAEDSSLTMEKGIEIYPQEELCIIEAEVGVKVIQDQMKSYL